MTVRIRQRQKKYLVRKHVAYGRTYNYKLVNTYEIEKTGTAHIKRNGEKNTLTLITCKHNTNKQLVFIFELNEII